MSNLEDALIHVAQKRYVFPCNPDKTPATEHSFKDATNDPDQVRSMWKKKPFALIGIACSISGFFAVDVDNTNSWNELESTYGRGLGSWMQGPIQLTPRGGFHLLYEMPHDVDVPNVAGKLAPGVDLRSRGYICSGKPGYEWIGSEGIYTPLTAAPAWLILLIKGLNKPHVEIDNPVHVPVSANMASYFTSRYASEAFPGGRNQMGFALAIQLRDLGLTEQEAKEYMKQFAHKVPQGKHLYTEAEALMTLHSAFSRQRRSPISPGYRGQP